MNALEQGLYNKLTGDSTLTAMLAGTASVFYGIAPDGEDAPYIVFNEQSDTPIYSLGAKSFDNVIYQVKAVSAGTNQLTAGSIAERIETVLNDATLTVTGKTAAYCRKTSGVHFQEEDHGRLHQHRGGLYRIYLTD